MKFVELLLLEEEDAELLPLWNPLDCRLRWNLIGLFLLIVDCLSIVIVEVIDDAGKKLLVIGFEMYFLFIYEKLVQSFLPFIYILTKLIIKRIK